MREFEEIFAWQKARSLCREIHAVAGAGQFGQNRVLRDQICRAAISVMSNIAEGFSRYGRTEFKRYLVVARRSAAEVRCQLYIALDLHYIDEETHQSLKGQCLEVDRLIAYLRNSLDGPAPLR
jgi:four helix bundle protein